MFGVRLKQLRKKRSLRQEDIAALLGLTRQAYGKYEREERRPDLKTLIFLADFFGVSTDYLLGISDIENPYDDLGKYKNLVWVFDEETVTKILSFGTYEIKLLNGFIDLVFSLKGIKNEPPF